MQAKLQVQQQQSPQALEQTQQATRPALERDLPPCPDTVLAKRVQVEAEFSASAKSNGDAAIKEESSAPPVASPYNGTATGMKSPVQSELTAKTSATLEEPDAPIVKPEVDLFNDDEIIQGESAGEPMDGVTSSPSGVKRKFEEVEQDAEGEDDNGDSLGDDDEDASSEDDPLKIKKNADGSVEQEDTVK